MIRVSPAIAPAARIRCSRSERFVNGLSFRWFQDAGERRGLAQPGRRLIPIDHDPQKIRNGQIEQPTPFFERRARTIIVCRHPTIEIGARTIDQLRMCPQLPRDRPMQCKAAKIEQSVIREGCRGRVTRDPPPLKPQPGRPTARTIAPHSLGGRGWRACRFLYWAGGRIHLMIVTRYGCDRQGFSMITPTGITPSRVVGRVSAA